MTFSVLHVCRGWFSGQGSPKGLGRGRPSERTAARRVSLAGQDLLLARLQQASAQRQVETAQQQVEMVMKSLVKAAARLEKAEESGTKEEVKEAKEEVKEAKEEVEKAERKVEKAERKVERAKKEVQAAERKEAKASGRTKESEAGGVDRFRRPAAFWDSDRCVVLKFPPRPANAFSGALIASREPGNPKIAFVQIAALPVFIDFNWLHCWQT